MTFISKVKDGAINGWHTHQILPSISIAQAILESASGTSSLGAKYNNLFGIKASEDWTGKVINLPTREYGANGSYQTNANFRWYDSWADSMLDHAAFFTNTPWRVINYAAVVGEKDYKKAAQALQSAGYATDPQYATKLIQRIEQNNLTQYDTEAFNGQPSNVGTIKKTVGGTLTELAKSAVKQYNVTLIGDSLGVGTQPKLTGIFRSFTHDVLGSRQITHATNSLNGTYVLQSLKDYGQLKDIVVVVLGTNRGVTDTEIDNFVAIAGNRKVIFVDTNSNVAHRQSVSDAYRRASERHNNVYHANWMAYSNSLRSRYYGSDNIHMTAEGYQAHADFIKMAVYEAGIGVKTTSGTIGTLTEYIGIEELDYKEGDLISPKGESIIYNHPANELWGSKTGERVIWIESILEVDSDDPQFILEAAVKVMKENGQPAAQYVVDLAELPDDVSIGDWGYVLDHEFNPPLYIHARVLEIITSETDLNANKAVIGNVTEVFPADKSDIKLIQADLKDVRDNLVRDYRNGQPILMLVNSTNGSTLGDKYTETELVAKVTQGAEDLTNKFITYKWERVSNDTTSDDAYNAIIETETTNRLIITSKDIVNNLSTFVVRVYDGNNLINQSSITIKHVDTALWTDTDTPPSDAKDGATWVDETGKHWILKDGEWEERVDQAQLFSVRGEVEGAIQEAEQAKEAAEQAYQDAIDEAERLVTEQDAVWQGKMDDYDAQVAQIEADAQSAQDKANQALIDVGISTDLAQTAKDLATTAQSNASTAITNASQAISDASSAVSQALSAFNLATSAKSDVSTISLDVDDLAGQVALKASQTVVDQLSGTVNNHTADISANAQAIQARLTSSQVSDLVDNKGLAQVTYVDNQINATAENFGIEMSRVEGKIPISVHEDNLVIKGDEYHYTNEYLVARYDLTKDLVIGKTYTIVLKGGIGADGVTQKFTLFTDNGGNIVGELQFNPGGIYKLTFVLVQNGANSGDKKHIAIYNRPNNGSPARIDWLKLIEGDVTDNNFTPSRADLFTQHGFTTFETDFNVKADGWDATSSYVSNNQTKINSLISNADGWQNTISYVDNNKTKINQTISRVDSYQQTIGANGENIAQLVMTDSVYQTSIRKGGRNLLKNSYGRIDNPNRLHSSFDVKDPIPNGTRVTLSFKASSGTNQVAQIFNSNSYYLYGDVLMTGGTTEKVYHISFTWNRNQNGGAPIDINNQSLKIYNKLEPNPTAYIIVQWAVLQYGEIGTEHYISDDEDFETQVTQLAGSWALNLKSGNDIKTQINASTDAIRLQSKFIHLNGSSLIDNATIKSAHIDTLNANKIVGNTADFNTIRTGVLTANAVTSTHIKADTALFDTLFSTTSATDRLVARGAWITNANIISLNADKINAGTISANRISTSSLDNIEFGGRNYAQGTTDKMQYGLDVGRYSGPIIPSLASKYTYTLSELGAKAGDTYTASIYIGAGGGYGSGLRIDNQTGSPQHYAPVVAHGYTSVTFTVKPTDTEFRFYLANYSGSAQASYKIEAREFKIEKGNKRTGWTRNPEDLGIAGKVEIHGGNIKADTLDVGAITGDTANFFQTSWQGLNSSVTVDSSKVRLTNSAKDFIEMNGIPEVRSQDSAGTAAIMGKGRSHYYSGNQARFYIGSNLEGLAQYGVHIAKGQTWGIYRNSDSYGGTPAQYHTVLQGEHWRSITTKYWNDSTSVNVLMQLNGYNVNNYPVLQPGDVLLIKAAVPGNQSGVERIWTMGTASNGTTRVYSHVHHVFEADTTGASDERMKHNIEPTEVTALDHIEALTFKQFNWNRDNKFEPLGLIAQRSGILRVPDEDMEGINIQRAIMLALKGIQELQEEIKQLKGA